MIEIFDNILLESRTQGHNWDGDAAQLFDDGQRQKKYAEIHESFKEAYEQFKHVAREEDNQDEKKYEGTEDLLRTISRINDDYFQLATPRFSTLLAIDAKG